MLLKKFRMLQRGPLSGGGTMLECCINFGAPGIDVDIFLFCRMPPFWEWISVLVFFRFVGKNNPRFGIDHDVDFVRCTDKAPRYATDHDDRESPRVLYPYTSKLCIVMYIVPIHAARF